MRGDCFNALHSLTNCSFVNIFNFPLQQFALNLPERERSIYLFSESRCDSSRRGVYGGRGQCCNMWTSPYGQSVWACSLRAVHALHDNAGKAETEITIIAKFVEGRQPWIILSTRGGGQMKHSPLTLKNLNLRSIKETSRDLQSPGHTDLFLYTDGENLFKSAI